MLMDTATWHTACGQSWAKCMKQNHTTISY